MTRVYIIRHAEAQGNLFRRGQGHMDGRVTPKGEKQIDCLARRFKEIAVDAIYSSDMSRTIDTAGAILRTHPKLILRTDPALREINMGAWEDRAWGDIARENPDMLRYFNHDPDKWFVPGGESFEHLQKRITSAVYKIAARHDGQTVVIVSHGMAIRSLMCEISGIPSGESMTIAHCENTAVALLEISRKSDIADDTRGGAEISGFSAEIIYRNDASHLSEGLAILESQLWWKSKSGNEENNLCFLPLEYPADADFYTECYKSAWLASDNPEDAFNPDLFIDRMLQNAAEHPQAVMTAMRGEERAGIIELDVNNLAERGYGWITLCAIAEKHRRQRLAPQLIGHAAHIYRSLGRKAIRLYVSERNTPAVRFYQSCGFRDVSADLGSYSLLLLMELEL